MLDLIRPCGFFNLTRLQGPVSICNEQSPLNSSRPGLRLSSFQATAYYGHHQKSILIFWDFDFFLLHWADMTSPSSHNDLFHCNNDNPARRFLGTGSSNNQKSFFERPSTAKAASQRHSTCSCFFLPCIVGATMHHGAYHEVGGAGLRTVHWAIVCFLWEIFLSSSMAWRGLVVVMGFSVV